MMSDLPLPTLAPEGFLQAIAARDDWQEAAKAAGCDLHLLAAGPDMASLAGLHAAGARALAASIARDGRPMLLRCDGLSDAAAYGAALEAGLMGYERIFYWVPTPTQERPAATAADLGQNHQPAALILILPPSGTNSYWQR